MCVRTCTCIRSVQTVTACMVLVYKLYMIADINLHLFVCVCVCVCVLLLQVKVRRQSEQQLMDMKSELYVTREQMERIKETETSLKSQLAIAEEVHVLQLHCMSFSLSVSLHVQCMNNLLLWLHVHSLHVMDNVHVLVIPD